MVQTPLDTSNSDKSSSLSPLVDVKRPRAILSCIACRDKKLKCDRGRPCNNCSRRRQTCRYLANGQSAKEHTAKLSTAGELNRRLQGLEDLLIALKNAQGGTSDVENAPRPRITPTFQDVAFDNRPQYLPSSDGSVIRGLEGTTHVDASSWQNILDDIHEVRDYLQQKETTLSSSAGSGYGGPWQPILLFGGIAWLDLAEIVSSLPPRATVDRLVSKFFNSGEPALMIIHRPTFLKEYEAFWSNSESTSTAWLGLLYSVLCLAIFFYMRSGQQLPSPLDSDPDALRNYQGRAAKCLQQSDYTKPGIHKLEALLIYFGSEYLLSPDAHFGVSLCLTIITRLAMHMGLHRDSGHFKDISLFDGEMRRRQWSLITQIERLTTFEMGIPSIIDRSQCSTRSPSNYQDADIYPGMTVMSPQRPPYERTILSYIIAKDRLVAAFSDIVQAACNKDLPTYSEVLHLDQNLSAAKTQLPSFLQIRHMSSSFTDPPNLIMQRYTLDFLYLKARCVLHRQYMTQSTFNPAYAGSRAICVDSACRILQHQHDIHVEIQAGGQLHQEWWFVSSLTSTDFLLAVMVLCLEISRRIYESTAAATDILAEQSTKEIQAQIQRSRQIWLDSKIISRDAVKASEAIEFMIHKVETASKRRQHASNPGAASRENCRLSNIANAHDLARAKPHPGINMPANNDLEGFEMITSSSYPAYEHQTIDPPQQQQHQSHCPSPNRTGSHTPGATSSSPKQGFLAFLDAEDFDWQEFDRNMSRNETVMDVGGEIEDWEGL